MNIASYFKNFPWYFFFRILGLLVLFVFVTVLTSFFIGRHFIEKSYLQQTLTETRESLSYARMTFSAADFTKWCDQFRGFRTRYSLITQSGVVLCDSFIDDEENMDNHLDRPELVQARLESFGTSFRYSETLQTKMYFGAIFIPEFNLFVRKGVHVDYLLGALKIFDASTFTILFPLLVLFMVVALFLGFYVSRPLRFLISKIRALEREIPLNTHIEHLSQRDEWATIATIIDRAREDLERNSSSGSVVDKALVEKMRVDFVANISHELRTPMTSIKGFAQLLFSQKHSMDESLHPYVEKILNSSQRLISMFEDLLKLSLIESTAHIEKTPVDLEQLLRKIIEEVRQKHPHKALDYRPSFEAQKAFMDQNLFSQALTNLIDNSFKYTKGKDIELAVSSQFKEGGVLLILSDHGRGIPKNEVARVFERFYRVDKSRAEGKVKGTGIGLSIVKHIVLKHEGRIWLESRVGEGTDFYIWIPDQSTR